VRGQANGAENEKLTARVERRSNTKMMRDTIYKQYSLLFNCLCAFCVLLGESKKKLAVMIMQNHIEKNKKIFMYGLSVIITTVNITKIILASNFILKGKNRQL